VHPNLPHQPKIDILKFDYSAFEEPSAIATLGIFHCFRFAIFFPDFMCGRYRIEANGQDLLARRDVVTDW
jgi:hypothetical protein